ncbi:MAG: hypothetical protein IPO67_12795 [Deltaproteobacteria bacterium]|nr:hypothetical protein [Deltaproteobacteria bacterium]
MTRAPAPAVIVLLYALLAAGVCAPALVNPAGRALGHADADTFNHVWGYWQVFQALAAGRSPLTTELLGYPSGGALYFIDLFGALRTLPVQWAFGPVVAYNVACWSNLWLAGLGAHLLAARVSGSSWAALVAGVGFAASPHLLGQAHNGISETLAVGFLPLFVWAALGLRAAPGRVWAVLTGVMLGLCGLSNWYYGLFAGLVGLTFVAESLGRGPRAAALRPVLPWALLPAALLVLPALWAFRATMNTDAALVARDADFVLASLIGHNVVDTLSFFRPGDHHSPDLLKLYDERLRAVVYLGWVSLGLAALGARGEDGARRGWVALAVVSWVLALGPFLYIGGDHMLLPGSVFVPLPFYALWASLPLFSTLSHAYRFVVLTQLALGVLAACALARRPRLAPVLAPLAALAVLIDSALLSPADWPVPAADTAVPAVYAQIQGEGAVIDLPVSLQSLAQGRYALYQTQHGRPIPYALNNPTPPVLDARRLTRLVIDLERSAVASPPPTLPMFDLLVSRDLLASEGFTAIVLHQGLYPQAMGEKLRVTLDRVLGPGVEVEGAVLYRLSPSPAGP